MNNKEICRFVNSKDIRQHLSDINYAFSTAEAAWLVYQCRAATLEDKKAAWSDIINTMPDQSVDSPQFDRPYESIHKVLKDFIAMKDEMLNMFMAGSPKCFYQYKIIYKNSYDNYDASIAYSSYDKALHQLNIDLNHDGDDILYGCIKRSKLDGVYTITAYFDQNAEITDIEIPTSYGVFDSQLTDFFNDLWFHFPVPFNKGDILFDPFKSNLSLESGPVVVTGITPVQYEMDHRVHTDSSDMNVWGYFQDEETGSVYHEVTWNYMDYEYYPKEMLTGKKRILKALSNYIKGEIGIDLLLNAYHVIILDEVKNDVNSRLWYTDEGKESAGLL